MKLRLVASLALLTAVLALVTLITGCSPGDNSTPSPSSGSQPATAVSSVSLNTGPGESPEVGKPAPNLKFTDTDGNAVTLHSLQGKPVLVNFWNIDCVPCFEEMPFFQQVYDNWTSEGLVFLSIDIGDTVNKVIGYADRNKLSFPMLVDSKSEVALGYGIRSFPTTILVDREGIILTIKIGGFTSRQQIETELLSQVFPEPT